MIIQEALYKKKRKVAPVMPIGFLVSMLGVFMRIDQQLEILPWVIIFLGWIVMFIGKYLLDTIRCPNCDHRIAAAVTRDIKYCPYCGVSYDSALALRNNEAHRV